MLTHCLGFHVGECHGEEEVVVALVEGNGEQTDNEEAKLPEMSKLQKEDEEIVEMVRLIQDGELPEDEKWRKRMISELSRLL